MSKRLREIVTEVQVHHHTPSCKKYNGSCRYGFPRFPCKETILAQPQEPIEASSEEEKKILEEKRSKDEEEFGMILKKAQGILDQKDLEKQIEREAIKLKLAEERKNPTDDENSYNKVLKSVIASYEALDKMFDDDVVLHFKKCLGDSIL